MDTLRWTPKNQLGRPALIGTEIVPNVMENRRSLRCVQSRAHFLSCSLYQNRQEHPHRLALHSPRNGSEKESPLWQWTPRYCRTPSHRGNRHNRLVVSHRGRPALTAALTVAMVTTLAIRLPAANSGCSKMLASVIPTGSFHDKGVASTAIPILSLPLSAIGEQRLVTK